MRRSVGIFSGFLKEGQPVDGGLIPHDGQAVVDDNCELFSVLWAELFELSCM